MAFDPVLLKQINEAFAEFVTKINSKGEKYFASVANRNRMIQWLKKEQVQTQDWISSHVWMAAYGNLSASESLETRPEENKKTRDQLEAEWAARDRFDGSDAARSRTHVSEKTPGQEIYEAIESSKEKTKRSLANIQKIAEAQEEQARAATDFSAVPSLEALREGTRLTKKQQIALPTVEHNRLYVQRLRVAESEAKAREMEEADV